MASLGAVLPDANRGASRRAKSGGGAASYQSPRSATWYGSFHVAGGICSPVGVLAGQTRVGGPQPKAAHCPRGLPFADGPADPRIHATKRLYKHRLAEPSPRSDITVLPPVMGGAPEGAGRLQRSMQSTLDSLDLMNQTLQSSYSVGPADFTSSWRSLPGFSTFASTQSGDSSLRRTRSVFTHGEPRTRTLLDTWSEKFPVPIERTDCLHSHFPRGKTHKPPPGRKTSTEIYAEYEGAQDRRNKQLQRRRTKRHASKMEAWGGSDPARRTARAAEFDRLRHAFRSATLYTMRRRLFHAWQLWLLEWNFLKKQMGSFIKIMANFVTKNETKPTYKKWVDVAFAGLPGETPEERVAAARARRQALRQYEWDSMAYEDRDAQLAQGLLVTSTKGKLPETGTCAKHQAPLRSTLYKPKVGVSDQLEKERSVVVPYPEIRAPTGPINVSDDKKREMAEMEARKNRGKKSTTKQKSRSGDDDAQPEPASSPAGSDSSKAEKLPARKADKRR